MKEVKLWEYLPVPWGMNPATATLDAKGRRAAGGIVSLRLPPLLGDDSDEELFIPSSFNIKVGRVLSAANKKRIMEAWTNLGDVLVDAGIAQEEDVDSDDTVEEEGSSKAAEGVEPDKPLTPQPEEPSADTLKAEREALLKRIASMEESQL